MDQHSLRPHWIFYIFAHFTYIEGLSLSGISTMNITTAQLMVGDHIQYLSNKEKFLRFTHINDCPRYPHRMSLCLEDTRAEGKPVLFQGMVSISSRDRTDKWKLLHRADEVKRQLRAASAKRRRN